MYVICCALICCICARTINFIVVCLAVCCFLCCSLGSDGSLTLLLSLYQWLIQEVEVFVVDKLRLW